jgi:inorganic pyrophosphatase
MLGRKELPNHYRSERKKSDWICRDLRMAFAISLSNPLGFAHMTAIDRIKPFAEDMDDVHVIIDTPRGSRNKLKWDRKLGVLKLSHILTAGAVFPFDFGFVPGTHGADGDALDVLVLTDEPLFPLCLVQARLIGVIEAEQTQEGKTVVFPRKSGHGERSGIDG